MDDLNIETLVNVIFKKLSLAYGRDFTNRWEGMDMLDVKSDWAHELQGFENNPMAIKYALNNLPVSKPPTVFEFRNIAYRAPAVKAPALPWKSTYTPEVAKKALAEARELLTRLKA